MLNYTWLDLEDFEEVVDKYFDGDAAVSIKEYAFNLLFDLCGKFPADLQTLRAYFTDADAEWLNFADLANALTSYYIERSA